MLTHPHSTQATSTHNVQACVSCAPLHDESNARATGSLTVIGHPHVKRPSCTHFLHDKPPSCTHFASQASPPQRCTLHLHADSTVELWQRASLRIPETPSCTNILRLTHDPLSKVASTACGASLTITPVFDAAGQRTGHSFRGTPRPKPNDTAPSMQSSPPLGQLCA